MINSIADSKSMYTDPYIFFLFFTWPEDNEFKHKLQLSDLNSEQSINSAQK